MATASEIIAGAALGLFVGAAAGLALTAEPADAGYGVDAGPALSSNAAAKSDMFVTREPVAVNRKSLPKALEVAEIQRVGDELILLDAKGRIVYRSSTSDRTTRVAKNTEVPVLTGLGVATGRIDTAFQLVQD